MSNEFILHLPTHLPVRRDYPHVAMDAVMSIADLPPYLFMGPIDESTFRIDSTGWTVTWRSNEETWFRIEYDAKAGFIHAHDQWLGCTGVHSCIQHNELDKLAKMLFMAPVRAWEEKAKEVFQSRWNLEYIKAEEGDWMVAGIPDGLMKMLMLPLSVDALPVLFDTVANFRDDPVMDFPVSGYVLPVMGTVNYVEGKNPDWTRDPGDLFIRTLLATGFSPLAEPVREVANDGTAAWTIRRLACMAFIGVPFAGMITLLEKLEQAGLLAVRPMKPDEEYPGMGSIEFSGCVLPFAKAFSLKSVDWWPEDRKRRIFWLLPEDHMKIFAEHASHRDDAPDEGRRVADEIAAKSRELLAEVLS